MLRSLVGSEMCIRDRFRNSFHTGQERHSRGVPGHEVGGQPGEGGAGRAQVEEVAPHPANGGDRLHAALDHHHAAVLQGDEGGAGVAGPRQVAEAGVGVHRQSAGRGEGDHRREQDGGGDDNGHHARQRLLLLDAPLQRASLFSSRQKTFDNSTNALQFSHNPRGAGVHMPRSVLSKERSIIRQVHISSRTIRGGGGSACLPSVLDQEFP